MQCDKCQCSIFKPFVDSMACTNCGSLVFDEITPLQFTAKGEKMVARPQVNMRVVGNCEYALLLYRDKLPKFNNNKKMIFNAMPWEKDGESEKIHPTQKPVKLLQRLITLFTDVGDVVIDPVAGSASTIIAALRSDRSAYGFEIKKDFYKAASKRLEQELSQGRLAL